MGNLQKFIADMRWWCTHGNLGYDQSNRYDIRIGGECDCSSLELVLLIWNGFNIGGATYTGNMSRELTANGWIRVAADGNPQPGDILLNDANHTAVYLGNGKLAQASIDERGEIAGGATGDQSGYETNVREYYDYPWDCYLRWSGGKTTSAGWQPAQNKYNPNGYNERYILSVQRLLNKFGYSLNEDGILGSKTHAAITDFQTKHGLTVDGIPGPNTLGTLKSADATPPATRRTYLDIRGIQRALRTNTDNIVGANTQGHLDALRAASTYGGITFPYGVEYTQKVVGTNPDGIWGENSRACHDATVEELQRELNKLGYALAVDGIYGEETDTAAKHALNRAQQA